MQREHIKKSMVYSTHTTEGYKDYSNTSWECFQSSRIEISLDTHTQTHIPIHRCVFP